MKFLCSVLILASVLAANAKPNVQLQVQSALDQYLVHARNLDVASASADVTTQCFNLYLPMLNEVAATFSSSYQACITTANAETANLTAEADKQQKIYQTDVTNLCSAFTTCNSDNDTTSFFNCYANAAESDVSVIYDIATNAASSASSLSMGIKAIQDTEYQCTNTSESNYVRDTAATYDLLDSCLKYGVPTTSAAPSTTSPVASTSGAIVTDSSTVIASSTAAPVTTAAPGTTPAVTTPAPGTTPVTETSAAPGTPASS
ncbi:putative GPI-anchored protein pfl2 [Drosophila eugracilis]|uniref:putative GPI-anchored protein pfl2 n=1 Tax=Drosophila eugracilis TaxID=29029 RepID=UPI0007E72520|nr:putative GPI-anchored protein pfl2 [Drosophila eugracilis]